MNNFCVGIWHNCERGGDRNSVGIYHNCLCQRYGYDKFPTNRQNTDFIMHLYLYWVLALKAKDFRIALLWRTPTTLIWCGISLAIYLYLECEYLYLFFVLCGCLHSLAHRCFLEVHIFIFGRHEFFLWQLINH